MFRFGCLLFLLPFVEFALLVQLSAWIGVWPVLGVVAGTALLGLVLVRTAGLRSLGAARMEAARGRVPGRSLLDGASTVMSGFLLLTPGVLTDLAGLGLLVPTTRRLFYAWVEVRLRRAMAGGQVRMGVWGWNAGTGTGGRDVGRDLPEGADEGGDDDRRPPRPGEIIQD